MLPARRQCILAAVATSTSDSTSMHEGLATEEAQRRREGVGRGACWRDLALPTASPSAIAPPVGRAHANHSALGQDSNSMAGEDWALLVRQADEGEPDAKKRLFGALYSELHRLAERQLRGSSGGAI